MRDKRPVAGEDVTVKEKFTLSEGLSRAWRFIAVDVWDIELTSLSALPRAGVKFIRVVNLVFKGFKEDECPLHASALTFSTLMSIVPILALSLALARGLGDTETAKNRIRESISSWTQTFRSQQTEVADDFVHENDANRPETSIPVVLDAPTDLAVEIDGLVERAFEKVENISFAALSGVGLVILLWMVIEVLGRVEASFNRVWGVHVGRSFWRRFTDYLSVLFILPFLIVAASSIPVVDFATRFLDEAAAERVRAILGSGLLRNLAVVVMTTLCFGFLISFMPNTKVKMGSGLMGGLAAALLFIGWMHVCATLQVGAARAGRIYGSFAIVPILLAWVHVSWQIVLFGAEVAFAVQNCTTYRMEWGAAGASSVSRMTLALGVVIEAGRGMLGRSEGFDISEYARRNRVSVRLLHDVVDELVATGYLAELSDRTGHYVLLRAPAALKAVEVINAMMHSGVEPDALGLTGVNPRIDEIVGRAFSGADSPVEDATIKDLA